MLISICFLFILVALILLIDDRYFSNDVKAVLTVVVVGSILYFENSNFAIFFISNSVITYLLSKIKNNKVGSIAYLTISALFFYSATIGHFLNNTFLTFYFSETNYIEHPIYCLPFVIFSIKSLYHKQISHPSFEISNFLKLVILTFFLFSIAYPIEKTFGKIQSLNFFQSLLLLLSFSSSIFIIHKVSRLFQITFDFIGDKYSKLLIAFLAILIVNTSFLHIVIIIALISISYIETKKPLFFLPIAQFFLLGLLFLPDFKSIQVMLSGFMSWSSIFLYYNEFYILNSIGADASFFIPLLFLFIAWNKHQHKSLFSLTGNKENIKLPQLFFSCLLLLFIF